MLSYKLNETRAMDAAVQEPLFLEYDETVSSAIGRMRKNKTYATLVKKGKKYAGVLTAQRIMVSDAPPKTTKAGSLAIKPEIIPAEESLAYACRKMAGEDLRAVPIGEDDMVEKILYFEDIRDWCLMQEETRKLKIKEIEKRYVPVLSASEAIDKVKVKLRENKLTRVLLEEKGKMLVAGIEDYVERMSDVPRQGMTLGELRGNPLKRLGIEARTIAEDPKVTVKDEDSLYKLLSLMKKKDSTYAVVGGTIITHKDVLAYLGTFLVKEDISELAVISTKSEFDDLTWKQWRTDLKRFLRFYLGRFGRRRLREFHIQVKDLHKTGERKKYIMKARLLTDRHEYIAEKEGWDPIDVFDRLINALRKQIREKKKPKYYPRI